MKLTGGEKQSSGEKNAMATMTELSPTAGKYSQDVQGDEKLSPGKAPSLCSTRYGIAFITHLCNFIIMAQNIIMNITMVTMANSTNHQSQFNSSTEGLPVDSFDDPNNSPKSLPAGAPVYDWSPQIQGIIFSSINYGVILTLAPSGYLAGRVGTKRMVGAALLGSSFLVLFTPLAADLGLGFLIATRILQGVRLGLGYGGQFALWERWSPPNERSRLCSIAFSGMMLGSCIAILLGGNISQALGWPFVFYIFGGVGCVSCLLWFVLIYDDPVTHPWMNITEKEYIISSLAQQVSSSKQPLPIKAMVRCLPLWSLCFCCFSHQWLINIMVVYTPTYISSVFNVDIRDSGFLSALPFICARVVGILGGYLADFLLTKNFRLVTVRKIATVLGSLSSSASLVVLPYVASSYITAVSLLTLSCGPSLFSQPGIYINALDIAPRHSSFLMGASRGFAQISAILAPTVSGFLLSQDPEFGWRNVFSLSFAINTLGLILYLIFGKADVQDWAKERKLTRL
ncbi:sodium-dependent phosphate transport protein 4 [Monodon monoceros]|nr:sodium-dependent phosphate transport protein 4 [Monodon monoceros]